MVNRCDYNQIGVKTGGQDLRDQNALNRLLLRCVWLPRAVGLWGRVKRGLDSVWLSVTVHRFQGWIGTHGLFARAEDLPRLPG